MKKRDQVELASLYCLPDEQSQLRTWWRSTPTLLTVGFTGIWVLILIAATIYDESKKGQHQENDATNPKIETTAANNLERICRSLSITNNLRSLFSTGKSSSMMAEEDRQKQQQQQVIDAPAQLHKEASTVKLVNLDMLEGIKVLAALYVISGHVIMLSTMIMNNPRELSSSRSIVWTVSNLMPAFAVNAFFVITGILTSYLMFKQNLSHSFITSPIKWVAFILYRYLRMMPMYVLVILFCEHVARYIGDGPLWDYGTSSLAVRRNCEQEPWAWTLLFGSNFKSPLKHCIPSALNMNTFHQKTRRF